MTSTGKRDALISARVSDVGYYRQLTTNLLHASVQAGVQAGMCNIGLRRIHLLRDRVVTLYMSAFKSETYIGLCEARRHDAE
jgi:hypothetical protein